MFDTLKVWLVAGSPPHYAYLGAVALLLIEDGIARSPLKANSTIQLALSLLGRVPSLVAALVKLGFPPKGE